jgi:hypothetical protein
MNGASWIEIEALVLLAAIVVMPLLVTAVYLVCADDAFAARPERLAWLVLNWFKQCRPWKSQKGAAARR